MCFLVLWPNLNHSSDQISKLISLCSTKLFFCIILNNNNMWWDSVTEFMSFGYKHGHLIFLIVVDLWVNWNSILSIFQKGLWKLLKIYLLLKGNIELMITFYWLLDWFICIKCQMMLHTFTTLRCPQNIGELLSGHIIHYTWIGW